METLKALIEGGKAK